MSEISVNLPLSNDNKYILTKDINTEIIILRDMNITDIDGIKLFSNLKELNLDNTLISDISPLKHLRNLEILSLHHTYNLDMNSVLYTIPQLTNLKEFHMRWPSNCTEEQKEQLYELPNIKKLYGTNVSRKNFIVFRETPHRRIMKM